MNVKLLRRLYATPWPLLDVNCMNIAWANLCIGQGVEGNNASGADLSRLPFDNVKPRETGPSITSILTTRVRRNAHEHRILMLSLVDRYLGFVFMTTALIYKHLRGIMVMKKFMESLNYVTNHALD